MIPGTPRPGTRDAYLSAVETNTFEHDRAATEAAAAARARFAPGLPPAADGVLARAEGVARIVAHYDPDPVAVDGVALYTLLAGGTLDQERGAKLASAETLEFALALGRLGRFDVSAQWNVAASGPTVLSGAQAEALRKMLLAVVADPRLVLARVAEQLWLLRNAKQLPDADRHRLALQTREVYGPLANRLGLAHLKWELEDHTFRHLQPDEYRRIASALNEKRADRERYIDAVRTQLAAELDRAGVSAEIQGRPKHIYSIWRKMQRKHLAFEQVLDVRALRILVADVAQCYAALGVVHGLWQYIPGEFDDYVATPKPNGYRSIHTAVLGPGGRPLEVQIRTREMHERAELGVAAHWRYKEGGKRDLGFERKLERLRTLLQPAGAAGEPEGLLDRVSASLFADRVYVISPKGDVVELPEAATPLDFAYHVHTSLGHRCRGAKVDGRMVQLDYRLKNGETVEIITAKEPQPSRDWLVESRGFLATKSARAKVRAWFRREDEADHRAAGIETVEREIDRQGAKAQVAITELAAELGLANADELYVAIGAGDVSPSQVANALQRRLRARAPEVPPVPSTPATAAEAPPESATGIQVMGVGDLLSSYARCCRPVPPEAIRGYVTLGRGVTIHRADCANLRRMREKQPDRVVDVAWGADATQLYGVEVIIDAYDRRGLVRDITGLLADARLSIDHMNTVTDHAERVAHMTLGVRVHDLGELDGVLARIAGLQDVIFARRR
jgi:GTP pyrophosphokinase